MTKRSTVGCLYNEMRRPRLVGGQPFRLYDAALIRMGLDVSAQYVYPAHIKRNYNATKNACDVLTGHCACGASHQLGEWVDEVLEAAVIQGPVYAPMTAAEIQDEERDDLMARLVRRVVSLEARVTRLEEPDRGHE